MSVAEPSFAEGNTSSMNNSFSFRSLGELQFNFETKECDFVLWISSLKKKLPIAEQHKQIFIRNMIVELFRIHLNFRIDADHFKSRPQPIYSSPDVLPIENVFMLYGVDLLSTDMIHYIFNPLTFRIKWINDSACMLFLSLEEADDMFNHLFNEQDYDLTEQNGDFPYRGWYQLQSYFVFGCQRKLYLRYATTNDIEIYKKEFVNGYGKYQQLMKAMPYYFLQKFGALQIYNTKLSHKKIRKQNQRRMRQQAFKKDSMIKTWDSNEGYLDQSLYYNIQDEYRQNDLNSTGSDKEISFIGNVNSMNKHFDDGRSFYSIVDAEDSFIFRLQDFQPFSFDHSFVLEEIE